MSEASALLGQHCAQGIVEIGHAFIMLGRDRYRLAETESVGLEPTRFAGSALTLVGHEDDRFARFARDIRERMIRRNRPGARVDHEEDGIGLFDGRFGLGPHAAGQAFRSGLLQSGGIDHGEVDVAESAFPLAPVAGDARPVVDERQPAADQPVEEGRLADIGATDNGDCEWHK